MYVKMDALIFDVFGDLGHFRKFYTTSSPLTFSFPPPPTVKGMLGAIAGIDKKEYLNVFKSEYCKIGIKIMNPVKKVRMGLNLINTKDNYWIPYKKKNHEARTQVKTEFLKNPMFRIYFTHVDNNLFDDISNKIKAHKNVYTLSLGLSEMIADYRFIDLCNVKEVGDSEVSIQSILPIDHIVDDEIKFEDGKKYFKEKIPVDMNDERIVSSYKDIIYEISGKSIKSHVKKCWEVNGDEYIIFF
ncbi:MAG: type I-B CRISPR-associated protein Cas5b [Thermoanaerobacteraceae bacterium]|nr:type I-B CRISPR-associated protein Cas5b [Thermoanaerobacteraceae bacterium]